MNIYIVGDLHGNQNAVRNFYRNYIQNTPKENEEHWMICLGDFGANYYCDYRDRNFKKNLSRFPFKYFVIRGNHEQRPSICAVREDGWITDTMFDGKVMYETSYPNIIYTADEGGIYNFFGRKTLIIPGAYSVDKDYRLMMGWSWFPEEQLAPHEMLNLEIEAEGQYFDFVFSHTCPYRYRPEDLFLRSIDQSKVDNTMEIWMDNLHDKITFGIWCFAHYHQDRIEAPHIEMFYHEIESLESIEKRWNKYNSTNELDWWLPKGEKFYMFHQGGKE